MAAFSKTIALALLVLLRPCVAACADGDAICANEELDDSALLSHRSVQLAVGNATMKTQKCGLIYCAEDAVCCKDSMGNGICGSPGSVCCPSSLTGGTTICAPGNQCNKLSGLCDASGGEICGTIFCGKGSVCCDDNPSAPLCGAPGSECCVREGTTLTNLCAAGTKCNKPTGTCYVPIPGAQECISKTSGILIQCAGDSVCCDEGSAPMCGGKDGTCCYGGVNGSATIICDAGMKCSGGICVA